MKYFSTLLPPPNLTGILHLGHMWNAILQDTLMRHYRLKLGEQNSYWGFGLDHAGISLQIKVEEEMRKSGIIKNSISTQDFQAKLWEWKDIHDQKITNQYRSLGYVLPIEEKRFTLDDGSVSYTLDIFKRLYRDRLIYRAEKLVNWDLKLNTAISDIEIEYRPTKTKLYTVKYYYSEDKYISVSTTRPETIPGDVAIFVNPEDTRYRDLVGKRVKVPMTDRTIEILADDYVDPSFGTGAMKCTPAHDFNDQFLGKKHSLPFIKVFDTDLRMLLDPYRGKFRDEAKELIIEKLSDGGLLTSEDYLSNVSYSSRSGSIVEPLLSEQWFLKSSVLAKQALDYWDKHPEEMIITKSSRQSELRTMLKNMEDWCISRQLEWGIKIPIYLNDGDHSLQYKEGYSPSGDVLDTWFSSSLWPSIVFQNKKHLFPLSVLISGKDILLFWISRMIFMSVYAEGILPFRNVFLHGLVLDSQNRKMSKSLNNGIDPIDLIKEYSHDSVRLFFLSNTHQDSNIAFSKQKLERHSKFIHKLNNAYIFIKKQEADIGDDASSHLNFNEQQILHFLRKLKVDLDKDYQNFSFSEVTNKVIDFVWERFCNQYLELYKILNKQGKNNPKFLNFIWNEILVLLNPLIPDFSEKKKIYSMEKEICFGDFEFRNIDWFFEYINTYSRIRKHLSISREQEIEIQLFTSNPGKYKDFVEYFGYLNHKVSYIGDRKSRDNGLVFAVYGDKEDLVVNMNLDDETIVKYKKLLSEEKKWLQKEIDFLNGRISGFNDKTPQDLAESVKTKLSMYERDLRFYRENYPD